MVSYSTTADSPNNRLAPAAYTYRRSGPVLSCVDALSERGRDGWREVGRDEGTYQEMERERGREGGMEKEGSYSSEADSPKERLDPAAYTYRWFSFLD